MKPMDIMKNMNDLDERYLAEAETAPAKPLKTQSFSRIAAIAAVAAVLMLTACAAAVGINYWFGQDDDGYYKIEYQYPLEPVTINQEAYDDMVQALINEMNYHNAEVEAGNYVETDTSDLEYSQRLTSATGWMTNSPVRDKMTKMKSLEEVEAYLGIELAISPELRDAINNCYNFVEDGETPIGLGVRGLSYKEMEAEYEATGSITPQGFSIGVSLEDDETNNWYAGFRIYIPLTEEFAENFRPEPWYSGEEQGQYYTKDYSNGSQDFLIAKVDYTEEYGGTCLAFYANRGVGYELYCCAVPTDFEKSKVDYGWMVHILGWWTFDGEACKDPEEIILPLIENVK